MKTWTFLVALLLALPFVAQAAPKETKTMINGRAVTVITDVSTQSPAMCVAALDRQMGQQGWHDQIHRSVSDDKVFVIYSQRNSDPCCAHQVKVIFWKAVSKDGRTYTESWVYNLEQREVNDFLDSRVREIDLVFKTAPIQIQ